MIFCMTVAEPDPDADAALVVMCCGAFGISSWRGANAVDSVVMLDVNPSLSMTVSSKERVLSVTPFNLSLIHI